MIYVVLIWGIWLVVGIAIDGGVNERGK